MAIGLRDKYGVTEFCGYTDTHAALSFLKNQSEILYSTLLVDVDLHEKYRTEEIDTEFINSLEREYGIPSLWPLMTLDRVLMQSQLVREYPYSEPMYDHDDLKRILQIKARAIIEMLKKERPDFVFIFVIGGHYSYLLYQIAKKMGIPTLVQNETRLNGFYSLTEDYKHLTFAEEYFLKINNGVEKNDFENAGRKKLKEFQDAPTPPLDNCSPDMQPINRRRQMSFLLPSKLIRSIRWFVTIVIRYIRSTKRTYMDENPFWFLIDRIKRKCRVMRGFEDLYDEPKWNEPFAFYPLHYDPEIATLLLAPYNTDQAALILQIAQSLPFNYKLYVKEHPAMMGYRPRSFYKKIKKMPNVKLIRPEFKSFAIIEKAKIITTITGSAGWEALLFKKPVVTFGSVFYNILSGATRCTNLYELPTIIKEKLERHSYNEQEIVNFISALLKESTPVDIIKLWSDNESDFATIVKKIMPYTDYLMEKYTEITSRDKQSS